MSRQPKLGFAGESGFAFDRLFSTQGTTLGKVARYAADLVSSSGYYPFGMQMPGRKVGSGKYRYAFNGKEKDQEGMGGGGSTYDYGFRIYNAQIGKFLSVDPLSKKYPMLTSYQFASNTPIMAIDIDGLEAAVVTNPNPSLIYFVLQDPNGGYTKVSNYTDLKLGSAIQQDNNNTRIHDGYSVPGIPISESEAGHYQCLNCAQTPPAKVIYGDQATADSHSGVHNNVTYVYNQITYPPPVVIDENTNPTSNISAIQTFQVNVPAGNSVTATLGIHTDNIGDQIQISDAVGNVLYDNLNPNFQTGQTQNNMNSINLTPGSVLNITVTPSPATANSTNDLYTVTFNFCVSNPTPSTPTQGDPGFSGGINLNNLSVSTANQTFTPQNVAVSVPTDNNVAPSNVWNTIVSTQPVN